MSEKIINIISEAFKVIPAGRHLVKQDRKKEKRYRKLGEFSSVDPITVYLFTSVVFKSE
mgnify:CR=1 FL=1